MNDCKCYYTCTYKELLRNKILDKQLFLIFFTGFAVISFTIHEWVFFFRMNIELDKQIQLKNACI